MKETLIYRAEEYRLLALGLHYPEPAVLGPQWPSPAELPADCGSLRELAALGLFIDEEMAGEYNRLFATRVAVSPHETAWVPLDKGVRLGQLAALFEAFGARAGGSERETPDHIGALLEFAALLHVKEILAEGPEQREVSQQGRRILLEEHLGRWAPAFGRALARESRHPFYQGLGERIAALIEAEMREWGIAPESIDHPLAEPEERLRCPMHRAGDAEDGPAPSAGT